MKKTIFMTLAVCLVLVLPISGFTADHQKSSWYFGIGAGTGSGNADGEELLDGMDDKLGPFTFHLGIGAIVTPRLHLGFDFSMFVVDGSLDTEDEFISSNAQIYNYFGAVSFYPFEEGLFFKTGLGLSKFKYSYNMTFADDISISAQGYGFMLGGGVDLWLGTNFNLGLHIEWSRQFFDDSEVPDNTDFYSIYVAFSWF